MLINAATAVAILAFFERAVAAPAPAPAKREAIVSGDQVYPLPIATPPVLPDIQIKEGKRGVPPEKVTPYVAKRTEGLAPPFVTPFVPPDFEVPEKRQGIVSGDGVGAPAPFALPTLPVEKREVLSGGQLYQLPEATPAILPKREAIDDSNIPVGIPTPIIPQPGLDVPVKKREVLSAGKLYQAPQPTATTPKKREVLSAGKLYQAPQPTATVPKKRQDETPTAPDPGQVTLLFDTWNHPILPAKRQEALPTVTQLFDTWNNPILPAKRQGPAKRQDLSDLSPEQIWAAACNAGSCPQPPPGVQPPGVAKRQVDNSILTPEEYESITNGVPPPIAPPPLKRRQSFEELALDATEATFANNVVEKRAKLEQPHILPYPLEQPKNKRQEPTQPHILPYPVDEPILP